MMAKEMSSALKISTIMGKVAIMTYTKPNSNLRKNRFPTNKPLNLFQNQASAKARMTGWTK